ELTGRGHVLRSRPALGLVGLGLQLLRRKLKPGVTAIGALDIAPAVGDDAFVHFVLRATARANQTHVSLPAQPPTEPVFGQFWSLLWACCSNQRLSVQAFVAGTEKSGAGHGIFAMTEKGAGR